MKYAEYLPFQKYGIVLAFTLESLMKPCALLYNIFYSFCYFFGNILEFLCFPCFSQCEIQYWIWVAVVFHYYSDILLWTLYPEWMSKLCWIPIDWWILVLLYIWWESAIHTISKDFLAVSNKQQFPAVDPLYSAL